MKVWLKSVLDENNDKVVMLDLPTTENALVQCMRELNLPEVSMDKNCIAVKAESLESLNNQKVNIDELQYLAKRLSGFDELETFYAAAHKEGYTEVKDLINLTFDVENNYYFLITDFADKKALSQKYAMAKTGSMSVDEYKEITEDAIDELLNGHKPVDVSEYGLLYEIKDEEDRQPFYNGYTFPAYLYDLVIIPVEITQAMETENKIREFLYFPCEDICIDKAINRIMFKSTEPFNISFKILGCKPDGFGIENDIMRMLGNNLGVEKLYTLNSVCRKLSDLDIDLSDSRFRSVLEYCHPQNINELETILQNYKDFYFIISIDDAKGYGEYLLYESGKYDVPIELEDYIDTRAFGDDALEGMLYKFTDEGFIQYDGKCDDIFEMINRAQEETQDISELCNENSIEMR